MAVFSTNRDWPLEAVAASALVLFVLIGAFLGLTQAAQRSAVNFLPVNTQVPKSTFFWVDVSALSAAFLIAAVAAAPFHAGSRCKCAIGVAPWIVLALAAMLWRQGQHAALSPGVDHYTMVPMPRESFSRPIERRSIFVRARTLVREPARTDRGSRIISFPGVGALYRPGNGQWPGWIPERGLPPAHPPGTDHSGTGA